MNELINSSQQNIQYQQISDSIVAASQAWEPECSSVADPKGWSLRRFFFSFLQPSVSGEEERSQCPHQVRRQVWFYFHLDFLHSSQVWSHNLTAACPWRGSGFRITCCCPLFLFPLWPAELEVSFLNHFFFILQNTWESVWNKNEKWTQCLVPKPSTVPPCVKHPHQCLHLTLDNTKQRK